MGTGEPRGVVVELAAYRVRVERTDAPLHASAHMMERVEARLRWADLARTMTVEEMQDATVIVSAYLTARRRPA